MGGITTIGVTNKLAPIKQNTMDSKALLQQIEKKHIENEDLSMIDIDDMDFSDCIITNVIFSKEKQSERVLKNVIFSNAVLKHVSFGDAVLDGGNFYNANMKDCSFQISIGKDKTVTKKTTINKVRFEKAFIKDCRFRNAGLKECDFRYADVINTTFENTSIELCDFYRTSFTGQNVFFDCRLIDSSIPSYFEGTVIRRENLGNNRILQEDFEKYESFLDEKRTKNVFNVDYSLKKRYKDAESIYRELSGLWSSRGYFSDANWAYIKARRMERKKMCHTGNYKTIFFLPKIVWNALCDFCFGYGESISRTIITYFLIVLIFAIILNIKLPDNSFIDSIWYSIKNMLAQTPEEIKFGRTLVDMLNLIQSTLGILITGILGFIIANKIRNQ